MVRPGSCDLHGKTGLLLSRNIRQVRDWGDRVLLPCPAVARSPVNGRMKAELVRICTEIGCNRGKAGIAADPRSRDKGGFFHVFRGDGYVREARGNRGHHRRKDSPDGTQPAVQAQLGEEDTPLRASQRPAGAKRCHGNGQIEAGTVLRYVCGHQVDGDSAPAQRQARVLRS